jgi:hypothetical protein
VVVVATEASRWKSSMTKKKNKEIDCVSIPYMMPLAASNFFIFLTSVHFAPTPPTQKYPMTSPPKFRSESSNTSSNFRSESSNNL